jgi:ELWxxDGT repeat protein
MVAMDGTVFILADRPDRARTELWRSDGSPEGTVLLGQFAGLLDGRDSFYPGLAVAAGRVFFAASDGVHGTELWVSDGSPEGTWLVKDISPGEASSYPSSFAAFGDLLYFSAAGGLWRSDGTEAGTVLLKKLPNGDGTSQNAASVIVTGPSSFFFADGWSLYRSDGTSKGTALVHSGTDVRLLAAVDGKVAFSEYDGALGEEPWVSDGAAAGTRVLRDIFPEGEGSEFAEVTGVNDTLFFRANSGDGAGHELWKTDGTTPGTVRVKDIRTRPGQSAFPEQLTAWNGRVYFVLGSRDLGPPENRELWRSDGTGAGTARVKALEGARFLDYDFWRGDAKSLVAGSEALFCFTDAGPPLSLWRSDGTGAGTIPVKTLSDARGARLGNAIGVGDGLFFLLRLPGNGLQLWRSDGTEAGTAPVKSLCGAEGVDDCDSGACASACGGPAASLGFSTAPVPLGTAEPFEGLEGVDRSRPCGPCLVSDAEAITTESELDVYLNLTSQLPSGYGIHGWYVGVSLEGDATLLEAGTEGTAAALEPEGYAKAGRAEVTRIIDPARNAGRRGAISVISFDNLSTNGLLPSRGTETILRLRLKLTRDGGPGTATLQVVDGLAGGGQPVNNGVVIRESSGLQFYVTGDVWDGVGPSLVIHFSPPRAPSFLRGDANGDGLIDISDPVSTLGWLFLGSAAPACAAAANPNGDAEVDISDATYLLGHLFLGGPAPLAPFPGCGSGELPSDAGLGCEEPAADCL